jgi:hypothetical protein
VKVTPDKLSLARTPALLSTARDFQRTTRLQAHPFVALFGFHCQFKQPASDSFRGLGPSTGCHFFTTNNLMPCGSPRLVSPRFWSCTTLVSWPTRSETSTMLQQMDEKPEAGVATPLAVCHTRELATLEQACTMEYQGAQCAFKDSMIH